MSLLKTLGSVNKLSYRAFNQKKKKKKKCCLDFEFVAILLWGKLTQLNLNISFGIIIVLVFLILFFYKDNFNI